MRVRVIRAFLIAGERQEIGSEIDVPKSLADEVIYLRKAARVADAPPAQPMTTQSAEALVPGSQPAPKGKSK